ncbi:trafficking protein particle complex subunit 6B [Beauveria brongniartii RCEF 3172]|uniref:Trafficking protein particle complex subunit 6B n=1 Tax=Beauveria brongniartii RCEF 3172 TaxID=1081107 RepID=A0A167GGT8_9HYPO|nr:trafficking protein particle complex subunit 6B [Beauveria brongniartii RCEF 3172]
MSLEPVMPPYNASDPTASFLSSSCLDFLLIELVPLAYRVTQERDGGSDAAAEKGAKRRSTGGGGGDDDEDDEDEGEDALPDTNGSTVSKRQRASSTGAATTGSAGNTRRFDDEDEELDAVHYRLETLGYRVGQGLVERFSRDRPRLNDTLDVIKFLCKDLWSLVFGKNIDNLKTNHRVCTLPLPFSPLVVPYTWREWNAVFFLWLAARANSGKGRLRTDRQRLPAVFADEHRGGRPGSGAGTAIPVVSVRHRSGSAGRARDQRIGAGRNQ